MKALNMNLGLQFHFQFEKGFIYTICDECVFDMFSASECLRLKV